jgi:penicillin-binding protein 2
MIRKILKNRGKIKQSKDIDPDEIFLDSQNLPEFNKDQFEGRIEKAISRASINFLSIFFILVFVFLSYEIYKLQVVEGKDYRDLSENNRLRHSVIFASRGNILDRNDKLIAWNEPQNEDDYSKRIYAKNEGIGNLIGYIKYPKKDKKGFYYELNYSGIDGVEKIFNSKLSGENGTTIVETNALNEIISQNTIYNPKQGESVKLTIDLELQEKLYQNIKEVAQNIGYVGGSGIIMDIYSGEILAITTYPELDSNKLTIGDEEYIKQINQDPANPFLSRATSGLYTPGSIVKPFMAVAALNEGVIDQYTKIVSRGELVVPNPYDPDNPSYFSDFQAYGPVNVKEALAVSSNIYFYVVGGGYEDIDGLGITRIDNYMRKFGFGSPVSGEVSSNMKGTVPNPQWKKENFDGDIWRLGDTYFTSIGQYGFQVTPLQAVRAVASIANGGKLLEPKLSIDSPTIITSDITDVKPWVFQIVREGMRQAVTEGRIRSLDFPFVEVAAKTGTAELGVLKNKINSSLIGFFPYDNPKYAFAIVMERGDAVNLVGGVAVMKPLFEWMNLYRQEYLR